jgi:hypothetical protein
MNSISYLQVQISNELTKLSQKKKFHTDTIIVCPQPSFLGVLGTSRTNSLFTERDLNQHFVPAVKYCLRESCPLSTIMACPE